MSRGKKWTKAEDEVLAQGIEEKTSYEDIAQALGRTEGAVTMRAFLKRRASKRYQRNNMNGTSAPKPKAKAVPKPVPKAPEPEGRYTLVPVVESTAVNASLNRLFIVCVASMVFSVSTLVLLSAALLTA